MNRHRGFPDTTEKPLVFPLWFDDQMKPFISLAHPLNPDCFFVVPVSESQFPLVGPGHCFSNSAGHVDTGCGYKGMVFTVLDLHNPFHGVFAFFHFLLIADQIEDLFPPLRKERSFQFHVAGRIIVGYPLAGRAG